MEKLKLYRIDPTNNLYRFYGLSLWLDLFGQWCCVKEWGRIGRAGQTRVVSFATFEEAEAAAENQRRRKEKRQYSRATAYAVNNGKVLEDRLLKLSAGNGLVRLPLYNEEEENAEAEDLARTRNKGRLSTADRLAMEKERIALMEELFSGAGIRGECGSSSERLSLVRADRQALLNERVIDILTENLGFGNCTLILHNAGVVTIGDLVSRTTEELSKIPNIGPKKIAAIKSELADYGLSLRRPAPTEQLHLKL